jgi:UDP-glucose 4-epimerase
MNVLVTGGGGYIGSVVVELLVRRGHSVVVFDDFSTGHRGAIEPKAKAVAGDLCNASDVERLFRENIFDCVMHLAGRSLVDESMRFPEKYYRSTLCAGYNLLGAVLSQPAKKIVFSSSASVYGEPEAVPILETAVTRPQNPYGETKLAFERMLHWFHVAHGLSYISLRYFNAAGATEAHGEHHDPETHLIPLVLRAAAGKTRTVEVYGTDYPTEDGTCVRDYIHVIDLAEAHVLGLDFLEKGQTGIYNLGNGNGYSVKQVLAVASEVAGVAIPSRTVGRRRGDPARLVASSKKAMEDLGWKPQHASLHDIIRSACAWMKAFPDGYPD